MHYFLYIAGAIVAAFNHIKDWDAHKTSFRRWAVLLLMISIGIGGIINSYYDDKKNREQHEEDQREIASSKEVMNQMSQDLSTLRGDMKKVVSGVKVLENRGKIARKDAVVLLSGISSVASAGSVQTTVDDKKTNQAK